MSGVKNGVNRHRWYWYMVKGDKKLGMMLESMHGVHSISWSEVWWPGAKIPGPLHCPVGMMVSGVGVMPDDTKSL